MSSPKSTSGKGFTLQRNQSMAESSYDPCAGIEFEPNPGSDELFEALKRAFPRGKNHRARMREAVIEFLIAEREAERSQSQSPEVVRLSRLPQQAPEQDGTSKQAPTVLSPENPETDAPSEVTSPAAKPTYTAIKDQRVSQVDATQHRAAMTKAAVDELTIVWSSVDGLPKKPRIKKIMTERELEQYRLRRVIGACKVCKSRKRKCTHNTPNPTLSCIDRYKQPIHQPFIFPGNHDTVRPSIEEESGDQDVPLAVPKEPHAHIFQSSPEEIQGLTQEQSDLPQICAEKGIPIQSVDQNEPPSTTVPDPNSAIGGSIQKHERAPPKAHLPLTDTTEILFPEDSYWTATENGRSVERISHHALSRQPTPSPTLSTTVSPELLRREPCPEEAPLHSRRWKQTISPKLTNFSLNPMQIIKDVGQYFRKTNRDTSRTSRKRSVNGLLPFPRRIPLDDVYLVDPEVVTRETMFMSKEMSSESEGHGVAIEAQEIKYAAFSAPDPEAVTRGTMSMSREMSSESESQEVAIGAQCMGDADFDTLDPEAVTRGTMSMSREMSSESESQEVANGAQCMRDADFSTLDPEAVTRGTMSMSREMSSESESQEVANGAQRTRDADFSTLDPEVVTRETMFMSKEMSSESEGHEVDQYVTDADFGALSAPCEVPALSSWYEARARRTTHEARALSATREARAPRNTREARACHNTCQARACHNTHQARAPRNTREAWAYHNTREASTLSDWYEAPALSGWYEAPARRTTHEARALSATYGAPAQYEAPVYEMELSYALSATHFGK